MQIGPNSSPSGIQNAPSPQRATSPSKPPLSQPQTDEVQFSGRRQRPQYAPAPRHAQRRPAPPQKKGFFRKTMRAIAVATVLGVGGAGAAGTAAYLSTPLPNVQQAFQDSVSEHQHPEILAADNTQLLGESRYEYVPISEVSPALKQALVAVEDQHFFDHPGIDPLGIGRAAVENVQAGSIREGASTLTQQLVKNLFLSPEQTGERKVKEAILALKLEQELSKDQILEMYLNNVYLGAGAYGVGAASQIYFNKPASELTVDEAALLAGLPKAPSRYNPRVNPDLAKERRAHVLNRMVDTGALSREEANRLSKKPLNLASPQESSVSGNSHFSRFVTREAQDILGVSEQTFWNLGLKIETTLDPAAQRAAETQVREVMAANGLSGDNNQAALVSVNRDGEIIAYVGGTNKQDEFDRASEARRAPGSSFKPFTYITALENGWKPSDVVRDEPFKRGNWEPQNYDRRHWGDLTLTDALVRSNNIVPIKLMEELGPENVIETAQKMGIQSPLQPDLPLAIGSQGVTVQEMTAAFNTINNDGVYTPPSAIARISDRNGNVLYERHPERNKVLDRETRDTIVAMMEGVVERGTASGVDIGRPAAGKTGTSNDNRDATFVGFTPEGTTGIWVGNDDNSPLPGVTGGAVPGEIWEAYTKRVLEGQPTQNFDTSEALPLN